MATRGGFVENLGKIYGIYTGGFVAFVILMAILEQLADALRALDDDHPQVRMEACAALGDLHEPAALPHLIKRLDDGATPVRQNAAIALGTIRHPDGFQPLADALASGPADLRFQAATSLAEIDPERAFDLVMAALGDNDGEVVGHPEPTLGGDVQEGVSVR